MVAGSAIVVPVAELLLATLAPLLGFDAQGCHRPRLEALHADGFAGLETEAVRAVLDALQRLFDLADQLALAIAGAQLEAELGLLRRAVVRIREVGGLVLHVQHGAVDLLHEVPLPRAENHAEMLELLLAHVLLALADDVRLYVARAGEQAGIQFGVDVFEAQGRAGPADRHDRGRRLGGFLLDGGLWRRLRGGPGLRLRLRRSSLRGSRFPRGSRRPGRDLRRRPGNLRRNCLAGLGRLDRRFLHGHLELPDPMEDAGLYRPHAVGLPVPEGSCRAAAAGSPADARNAVARGGFF